MTLTKVYENKLKNWLLNAPIAFSITFFLAATLSGLGISFIQTLLNYDSMTPLYILFALSFVFSVWFIIKKLPNKKMLRADFIAITNAGYIISIAFSIISLLIYHFYGAYIHNNLLKWYLLHHNWFFIISTVLILLTLYFFGLAISVIYAKYKRCREIGLDRWKIILSMPFSFLMIWAPGYISNEKKNESNMEIKSNWYAKFNKWVLSSFSNTIYVFMLFVLTKAVISGFPTFMLTATLLIIYLLWYVKHKSDFMKDINKGYALTSVGINLAIILSMITIFLTR